MEPVEPVQPGLITDPAWIPWILWLIVVFLLTGAVAAIDLEAHRWWAIGLMALLIVVVLSGLIVYFTRD